MKKEYQSKKDETVFAVVEREEEKYGTTLLVYKSGPDSGKAFSITNSTLKRWWREVADSANPLDLDMKKINEPYNPGVTPQYIKKPSSVVAYEESKIRRNKDLPSFALVVEQLGPWLKKVNDLSNYVLFKNNSTLWVRLAYISIYATEPVWIRLTEAGLMSTPNKDKVRPFAFKLTTTAEYEKAVKALSFE